MFAFGHLIAAWIIGKIYESKLRLTNHAYYLLLLGGILPDIDFLLDWILKISIHRTITHSIFFLISISLMAYFILPNKNKKNLVLALAIGISSHLLLDMLTSPGITLLWPYPLFISIKGFSAAANTSLFSNLQTIIPYVIIDMALGTAWIFYMILTKKIRLSKF
jgi:membrane-bound metal-dependent hydrolase YbcI (DUF457 family)